MALLESIFFVIFVYVERMRKIFLKSFTLVFILQWFLRAVIQLKKKKTKCFLNYKRFKQKEKKIYLNLCQNFFAKKKTLSVSY